MFSAYLIRQVVEMGLNRVEVKLKQSQNTPHPYPLFQIGNVAADEMDPSSDLEPTNPQLCLLYYIVS